MRVALSRFACLALAAVTALAAAGCGQSEEEAVEAAVQDYASALRDGDFDEACDSLTDGSRDALEQMEGGCPAVLERTVARGGLNEPDSRSIEFEDDFAKVEIKGEGGEALLRKEDGEWRFSFGLGGEDAGG